jgi:hypothetical protein
MVRRLDLWATPAGLRILHFIAEGFLPETYMLTNGFPRKVTVNFKKVK